MKKVLKRNGAPPLLDAYLRANPSNDWEQFTGNDRDGASEVRGALQRDQRGLCAYCEIDLAPGHGRGLDDFRVEHFHPKKPHQPPPNHALHWQNLLAVCTGGNARDVAARERFTSPDHSCDVPKENHNWVGQILDPLTDIPAFPPLFAYVESTGAMTVDQSNCPEHLVAKAEASIEKLRLSPSRTEVGADSRLLRFRKAVIDALREELGAHLASGLSLPEAAEQVAEVHFPSSPDSTWSAFFSCIRWYLGPAAERRLTAIGYQG
jgi:uncharacterized protein (TIGR02646 family)